MIITLQAEQYITMVCIATAVTVIVTPVLAVVCAALNYCSDKIMGLPIQEQQFRTDCIQALVWIFGAYMMGIAINACAMTYELAMRQ